MHDPNIEAAIKKRLPEDVILWVGRPHPSLFAIYALRVFLFNHLSYTLYLLIAILLLLFPSLAGVVTVGVKNTVLFILALAAFITFVFLLSNFITAVHTSYAVTNKRLVILTRRWLWMMESMKSYGPDKLFFMKTTIYSNGMGSINFSRKSFARRYRGRLYFVYRPIGFWGIDDVKTVEEIIRYQFLRTEISEFTNN